MAIDESVRLSEKRPLSSLYQAIYDRGDMDRDDDEATDMEGDREGDDTDEPVERIDLRRDRNYKENQRMIKQFMADQ